MNERSFFLSSFFSAKGNYDWTSLHTKYALYPNIYFPFFFSFFQILKLN